MEKKKKNIITQINKNKLKKAKMPVPLKPSELIIVSCLLPP